MNITRRSKFFIVAVVAVALALTLILVGLNLGSATAPKSLAKKMMLNQNDLETINWQDESDYLISYHGENSHAGVQFVYALMSVHLHVYVWNSTADALAGYALIRSAFNESVTTSYVNITIGDVSVVRSLTWGDGKSFEILFIRGNVTGYLMCENLSVIEDSLTTWNTTFEKALLVASVQDMKIIKMHDSL